MGRKALLVVVAFLAVSVKTAVAGPECVSQRALDEVREQLSDEVQETTQQLIQMAIILERIESKVDKLENRVSPPAPHPQAVAPVNGKCNSVSEWFFLYKLLKTIKTLWVFLGDKHKQQ